LCNRLGEATDHISEASVSDLNKAMTKVRTSSIAQPTCIEKLSKLQYFKARGSSNDPMGDTLRDMLFELPGQNGQSLSRQMDGIQGIRNRAAPGSGFDPLSHVFLV